MTLGTTGFDLITLGRRSPSGVADRSRIALKRNAFMMEFLRQTGICGELEASSFCVVGGLDGILEVSCQGVEELCFCKRNGERGSYLDTHSPTKDLSGGVTLTFGKAEGQDSFVFYRYLGSFCQR